MLGKQRFMGFGLVVLMVMGSASTGLSKPDGDFCYIPPKFKNVPKKGVGVVFPASDHVVGNMISALGEKYSHVITVETLDGNICSHTTFNTNTIKKRISCDEPLNVDSLRNGLPGVEHKKQCLYLTNWFGVRKDGIYIWQNSTNGCAYSNSKYQVRYHGNRSFNPRGGCSGYADMDCGWNVQSSWNYANDVIDKAYNAVWDTTYNVCMNESWNVFMKIGIFILGCNKSKICRNAASQVANEFLYGGASNNLRLNVPHNYYSHNSPASPDKLYHAATGKRPAEKTQGGWVKCDSI